MRESALPERQEKDSPDAMRRLNACAGYQEVAHGSIGGTDEGSIGGDLRNGVGWQRNSPSRRAKGFLVTTDIFK